MKTILTCRDCIDYTNDVGNEEQSKYLDKLSTLHPNHWLAGDTDNFVGGGTCQCCNNTGDLYTMYIIPGADQPPDEDTNLLRLQP